VRRITEQWNEKHSIQCNVNVPARHDLNNRRIRFADQWKGFAYLHRLEHSTV
jgi:hypothetical protein